MTLKKSRYLDDKLGDNLGYKLGDKLGDNLGYKLYDKLWCNISYTTQEGIHHELKEE